MLAVSRAVPLPGVKLPTTQVRPQPVGTARSEYALRSLLSSFFIRVYLRSSVVPNADSPLSENVETFRVARSTTRIAWLFVSAT